MFCKNRSSSFESAMLPSSTRVSGASRKAERDSTINLDLQPLERGSRELLLWGSVLECIGNVYFGEILEDGALHCQFVEIGVEEGDDTFREG